MNNYIWLFGENVGNTSNNNSFYMWKYIVGIDDGIEKYLILNKNKENLKVYRSLSSKEKRHIIWKNSLKHIEYYRKSDMLFVTLSYKDVLPDKFFLKSIKMKIRKPIIYLQHGTIAIKKIGYSGQTYDNYMFRFCYYNPKIKKDLVEKNNFKDYQLYYAEFMPRYMELVKKEENFKEKNQILWFITWREYIGDNIETKLLVRKIKKIVNSSILISWLENKNITLKICVHQMFEKEILKPIIESLTTKHIVFSSHNDVMEDLAKSELLITDYSSIGFDFTFLNKPVVLYQPDLEFYLKNRKLYCELEDLKSNSVLTAKELIDYIVNEDYKINPFFQTRLPKNIDYKYIKLGKHIDRMYEYFSKLQKNKITFIGYNFYGVGGTVNATRALAEGLLEKDYLVELLSLKKVGNPENFPYGLIKNYIYFGKTKSIREKIIRNLHKSKKNLSYLKYDANSGLIHPYAGYALGKLMRNIRTNTLVSTRESLHFFLKDCNSEKVKNKIYFFHCNSDVLPIQFPGAIEKLKNTRIGKAIFVTESNRNKIKQKYGYNNYDSYLILGNTLEQFKIVNIDEVKKVEKKKIYKAIYLLRISKDRKKDLQNLYDFGEYLNKHNVQNIVLDVYGTGDYLEEFLDAIEEKNITNVINYCGLTTNPCEEIRNHDLMIDLSLNHSFGMTYIEAILNGKKVFCMKNPGSIEVMENIPNSYIESYESLCEHVKNIYKITTKELQSNYKIIYDSFSRETVTDKFIKFLD